MKKNFKIVAAAIAAALLCSLMLASQPQCFAAPSKGGASVYLGNAKVGNPGLKSIGRISFGPDSLLLVAEPSTASIVAIDTRDRGPVKKLKPGK